VQELQDDRPRGQAHTDDRRISRSRTAPVYSRPSCSLARVSHHFPPIPNSSRASGWASGYVTLYPRAPICVVDAFQYAQPLMGEVATSDDNDIRYTRAGTFMNRASHILVVVDPSATGRQSAVEKATRLARCIDASVELLICDTESARDEAFVLRAHPSNTQLLDLLDSLAAPMRAHGLDVTVRLIYGNSLHESLLEYFDGSNADLIVKDTHHHSIARRTFLGNTDWHLAHGSGAPLLLTKTREWGQPPVIVAAVDPDRAKGGTGALNRQILNCATSLAGRLMGDLHVIHTYFPAALAVVARGTRSMTPESMVGVQVENEFQFRQVEQLANTYGVPPERLHVEMGIPEECLTDSAAKYRTDVMVMGASSHGRWHRVIIGSTASTVLESLPCDILVVRPSNLTQVLPF
jgi:universal stress protein E